jgi:ribonuclease-3
LAISTLIRLWFLADAKDKAFIRALQSLLGFYPRNISLYKLAFSHRSLALETTGGNRLSNERLEYLGDAVLGAVVADLLFKKYPFKDEGFLTEMRSRIVSREHLKHLAVKIGIDEMLQKDAGPGTYRSMYGDAFEAFIGAIYLDRGYAITQHYLLSRIIRPHVDLGEIESTEKNFKSVILNWSQRERKSVVFEMVEEDPRARLITVRLMLDGKQVALGSDHVKKKAEQVAAERACRELGLL